MGVGQGPTVTRRRLRSELRRLREERGLTQEQVASEMEWSPSKLIRIEAGTVGISLNDLRALLALFEVTERDRVREMEELARSTRQRMWWGRYREAVSPTYLEYIGFEADATSIEHVASTVVPGLLQTEAYARAITEGVAVGELSAELVDARVRVRQTRQQDVVLREDPAQLTAVLDEAALRRVVGDRTVMRDQLRRLRELADRPNITIAVTPFEAGAHAGLAGSFAVLDFADATDTPIVALEASHEHFIIKDRRDEVEQYLKAFQRLLDGSRQGKHALDLIDRVTRELS